MILILSIESDFSTSDVIKWLRYMDKPYIRINGNDRISIKNVCLEKGIVNISFQINRGGIIQTKDITSYWYRRGGLFQDMSQINNIQLSNITLQNIIKNNLKNDFDILVSFLIYAIEQKKGISSIKTAVNNKLIHLTIAQQLGITTPFTRIISTREEFQELKKSKKEFITKCISDGVHYTENDNVYALYTQPISNVSVKNSSLPLLIQEKITKKWELRVFYLKGKFYSMAIFSQQDHKTQLDFRKYNKETPNYRVPYNLPVDLEKKLNKFMMKIGLDTGSIDMLYSKDGDYYFLEVNPVGQFGMVSYPCNYYLEKEFAKKL